MNSTPVQFDKAAFATEYAEKIFYFCLRKCGNSTEAEDLAQDIVLCLLISLGKTQPDNLHAYVWQVARNRYAKWAAGKRKRLDSESGTELHDLEFADTSSPENECIHAEDLRLMRRELAFIAQDYREIVVAHYIDNRTVSHIAHHLDLPRGTVLWRLHRAREKLKEGMNMSRNFGSKSYKPEEVAFHASGSQNHGLPWSAVGRITPKNILLAANNNPSTIEELAIELGIAAPYMEEEVALLEDARLLKKVGDKYVTNFFIADSQCQIDTITTFHASNPTKAEVVGKIAQDILPSLREMGIAPTNISDDDLMWMVVYFVSGYQLFDIKDATYNFPVKHKYSDDDWGFIGYENFNPPANFPKIGVISNDGFSGNSGSLRFIFPLKYPLKYSREDFAEFLENSSGGLIVAVEVIGELLRNKSPVSAMSSVEKEILNAFVDENLLEIKGDKVLACVPVFKISNRKDSRNGEFLQLLEQHKLYPKLKSLYEQTFADIVAILRRYANPVLSEQLNYCASMLFAYACGGVVDALVENGTLIVPPDPETSLAGVYLEI
ncbi:MAG: RNA polymerase sigma factor [Oscillospiraceae bacterium]|nr:RNA polymerase sigma factor [Oscillospiraceae bacterium]